MKLPSLEQLQSNISKNMPKGAVILDIVPVECEKTVKEAFKGRVDRTHPEKREVVFTFHGSHPNCYKMITQTGFRGRPNSYVAPTISQAHLYTRRFPLNEDRTQFELLISILVIPTDKGARNMYKCRGVRQPVRIIGCIGGTFAVEETQLLLPVALIRYSIPKKTRAPQNLTWNAFALEQNHTRLFDQTIARAIPCVL